MTYIDETSSVKRLAEHLDKALEWLEHESLRSHILLAHTRVRLARSIVEHMLNGRVTREPKLRGYEVMGFVLDEAALGPNRPEDSKCEWCGNHSPTLIPRAGGSPTDSPPNDKPRWVCPKCFENMRPQRVNKSP